MLTDYHVHLRPDEPGTTAQKYFTKQNACRYHEAAARVGVTSFGISEHIYRFKQALSVWRHPLWEANAHDDLDEYLDFLGEEQFKRGIEADFVSGREDQIAALLENHQFDYVIGSVHFICNGAVDHPDYDVWDTKNIDPATVWETYFRTLGAAAKSGLFDILAHPDLVKVWGGKRPLPPGDLRRFYDLAMDGIAESQIAIEVSTAGLRKPVGEMYPAQTFLEMCLEAGCPVVVSSDAHTPETVGYRFDAAYDLLQQLGVSEVATFQARRRTVEPATAPLSYQQGFARNEL